MTELPLSTDVLRRSMKRLGWAAVGSFRNDLQYWEPRDLDERQFDRAELPRVILPIRKHASDTEDLLGDAALLLSQQHGKEFHQVVETVRLMLSKHLDEIEVRRATSNAAGLIHWQLGNDAIVSTRDILSASAKASSSRRKRFYNAESVIAEEFLAQCYMGQTRVGSYVVTALTPAEASLATSRSQKSDQLHPRIEGRMVTETLAESLGAVQDAITEAKKSNGQIEAFEMAVASGVSYELLSALEPLTRGTESGIEISYFRSDFTEDGGEPLTARIVEFAFTPEDNFIIGKARQYFEASLEAKDARLTGEVTDLKNSSAEAEHRIKLAARINGKPKSVTIELTPEQYTSAVEAHGLGRLFTVVGELEMQKRAAHMHAPGRVVVEDTLVSEAKRSSRKMASTALPPPLFDF
ncbi:hypothetical protein MT356_20615 [Rathayibacter festucae]|uniref:hypothetical protein n=1 Tax=Rathayibacter festucae TaxID=110937 RepID=UPI001FB2D5ED|nr:hypothetical protein [Rathayibacter festucae]MCJ1702121.1 hypothetical protein [Rathayibacter festucae]